MDGLKLTQIELLVDDPNLKVYAIGGGQITRLKNYRAAILLQNLQQNQLCDSQIQNQIPQLLQLLHRFHSFAIPKYNASASVIPQLLQLCVLYFVTKKKKKIVDGREKLRCRDCEITEERELG
jgi:hypothetical protein